MTEKMERFNRFVSTLLHIIEILGPELGYLVQCSFLPLSKFRNSILNWDITELELRFWQRRVGPFELQYRVVRGEYFISIFRAKQLCKQDANKIRRHDPRTSTNSSVYIIYMSLFLMVIQLLGNYTEWICALSSLFWPSSGLKRHGRGARQVDHLGQWGVDQESCSRR
jgi:hypothetical protein